MKLADHIHPLPSDPVFPPFNDHGVLVVEHAPRPEKKRLVQRITLTFPVPPESNIKSVALHIAQQLGAKARVTLALIGVAPNGARDGTWTAQFKRVVKEGI